MPRWRVSGRGLRERGRMAMGLLLSPQTDRGADMTAARITRLDLCHLPRLTDASMHTALIRRQLRLEFLAVTDK